MRLLHDLDNLLAQLIAEHERLRSHLDAHQAAMRQLDLKAMDAAGRQQEACRLRIATLETRRRTLVVQIGKLLKVDGNLTLARLAELQPALAPQLLDRREKLREIVDQVAKRTHIAGRLAGALLGHMNTVVRVIAGAVEQAGVYTKHGVPQVSSRIGVMEAVG